MGKKKKGRSVKKNVQLQQTEPEELLKANHSFVIHRGLPGDHIVELTKDFRKVMEPFTASSLKERKKNTIKDFVSIAGVFHVSHLCVFSRTELGIYLKLARLPRGPTLSFKVHSFSLARDVVSSLKKQLVFEEAFKHSPLIILNNFSGEGMQMKLMATMFQNMFPTINLNTVNLNTIRRCVLMNYNSQTKLIDFRHYIIKAIPVGVSKGVKKVIQGKVPNLAKCNDISEFFTKTAYLSESEAEDDENSRVTLAQKLSTRGNMEGGESAIRLSEIGPRLTLQLIKVEDGLMDGEVLYHELVVKTEEEIAAVRKKRELKKKLKEKRKKIQEENQKKKEEQNNELKEKSLKGMGKDKKKPRLENDILMKRAQAESNEAVMGEDDDDAQYYREEVGEEPDQDLFSSQHPKRKFEPHYKSKTPRDSFEPKSILKKGYKNRNTSADSSEPKSILKKGFKNRNTSADENVPKSFLKKRFKNKDKTNSSNRDKRTIGGNPKKPGGRGGHPKYGFKAQREQENDTKPDKKLHKVKNGRINKNHKKKNKR
ncbi:protein Peter pan [Chrysoperla carnea]|uniref:protein Peter pan n=1 Tax=Chrysoperla carnea TaxID=189513 RepID=UPI001D085199|nr:protein Peter pan [Chrysoperla carnea]